MINTLLHSLKSFLRFFLPVYALNEESGQDRISLNVIYGGYSKQKMATYGRIIFAGRPFKSIFLGVVGFWALSKYKKNNFIPDIIISETNPMTTEYFFKRTGYLLPKTVNMKIDLTRPIKEMRDRGNGFDDTERKIRKHHWEYEVTEDPERLKEFYFKMYVPYVRKHEERAVITCYPLFQQLCQSAFLLLAKKEGVPCGGVLLTHDTNNVSMNCLGVSDGDREYLKEGVVGAVYYYAVLESQHRGYSTLELGGVYPFLNDGLTRYKLGFKGEFIFNEEKSQEYLWMSWRTDSESARMFLKENPVISLGKNRRLTIKRYE